MRPGPDTATLAGAVAVGCRVDVVRGSTVLAVDVPTRGAVLEWAGDKVVPAQLKYEAPLDWVPVSPLDPLNRFGQRSQVTAVYQTPDGRRWEVPLGEYLHTSWSVSTSSVTVTAVDLMQLLEQDPMAWPSSPAPGATLRTEMQRLAGTLPVVLDAGVSDSLVPVSSQWGSSRTEAALSLATSKGCGLRVGPDACLHVYPLRDASALDAVYTTADLLLDIDHKPLGTARRPNRWVVTGTSQDGQTETRWTAERTHYEPPYDLDGYGQVTAVTSLPSAAAAADVEAAAAEQMRAALAETASRTIEIVPDPRIEVGDVIGVTTADGEALAGRVTAYALPLSDPKASMRVDVDVLSW